MRLCYNDGSIYPDKESVMRVCEICGKEYADHLLSCPHCGAVPDPAALKDATAMFDAILADDPMPLFDPEFAPLPDETSDFSSESNEDPEATEVSVPDQEPSEEIPVQSESPLSFTEIKEEPEEPLSSGDTREFSPLGDTAEFPAVHEKLPAEEDHNDPERTRKVLEMYGGSDEETPSVTLGAGIIDWFDELRHSALSFFRRSSKKNEDISSPANASPEEENGKNPAGDEISLESVDKLYGFTVEEEDPDVIQEDFPENAEFLTSLPLEEEGTVFDDLMDSYPPVAETSDMGAHSDDISSPAEISESKTESIPSEEADTETLQQDDSVSAELSSSEHEFRQDDSPLEEEEPSLEEESLPDSVIDSEEISVSDEEPVFEEKTSPELLSDKEESDLPVTEQLQDLNSEAENESVLKTNDETAEEAGPLDEIEAESDAPESDNDSENPESDKNDTGVLPPEDGDEKMSPEEITAWLHEISDADVTPVSDETVTDTAMHADTEPEPEDIVSEIESEGEISEAVASETGIIPDTGKTSDVTSLFNADENDTPQEELLKARGLKRGGVIFLALLAIAGVLFGIFKYYLPKLRAEEQEAADRESAYQDLVCGTWMSDVFIYADETHPSREVLTLERDYSYKCDIWTSSSDREAFDPEIWSVTDTIEGTYFLELDAGSIRVTYTGTDGEEHVYRRFVRDAGGDKLVLREYYNENLTEYFDVEFERYNEKIR